MKKNWNFTWYEMIATFFYVGNTKFMPGTMGSLAAFPLFYFAVIVADTVHEVQMIILYMIAILFVVGYVAIRKFQKIYGVADFSIIVIDEVIGQLVPFAIGYSWIANTVPKFFNISNATELQVIFYMFLCAFIPFRFFDIRKPLYIWLIDRMFKGPLGIIFDDVLAGIYTAAVFFFLGGR